MTRLPDLIYPYEKTDPIDGFRDHSRYRAGHGHGGQPFRTGGGAAEAPCPAYSKEAKGSVRAQKAEAAETGEEAATTTEAADAIRAGRVLLPAFTIVSKGFYHPSSATPGRAFQPPGAARF